MTDDSYELQDQTVANFPVVTTSTGGDLALYNPEQGIKAIAVAEAAENYYARARDGDLCITGEGVIRCRCRRSGRLR